ncbi:MAG: hypothetical protein ACLSGS_06625 [Adlercreutzia sp.]
MTIYTGTPTPPTSPGTVFARMRRNAHRDKPPKNLCWFEWAATEIGDVHDQQRWYQYNPSLGTRLLKSVVVSESEKMTPDGFARERLGWWNDQAGALSDIDLDAWAECKTDKPCMDGYNSYDGAIVTLVACARPASRVNCLTWRSSPAQHARRHRLAGRLADRREGRCGTMAQRHRHHHRRARGSAHPVNSLIDKGVSKECRGSAPFRRGGRLFDARTAVNDHGLTHFGQPLLDEAVGHAKHRKIGDGFGYETSMENIDVSPVEAVALAYWNVKTSKRHPGRRAKAVAF